jgi:hypothetical protein
MKKIILSIGALALIALAAVNVSIALQSEKGAKLNLASQFSLADNENGGGTTGENGDNNCGKLGTGSSVKKPKPGTGCYCGSQFIYPQSCVSSGNGCTPISGCN